MKTMFTTPTAKTVLVRTAFVSGLFMAVAPGIVIADPMEKKGTLSSETKCNTPADLISAG